MNREYLYANQVYRGEDRHQSFTCAGTLETVVGLVPQNVFHFQVHTIMETELRSWRPPCPMALTASQFRRWTGRERELWATVSILNVPFSSSHFPPTDWMPRMERALKVAPQAEEGLPRGPDLLAGTASSWACGGCACSRGDPVLPSVTKLSL